MANKKDNGKSKHIMREAVADTVRTRIVLSLPFGFVGKMIASILSIFIMNRLDKTKAQKSYAAQNKGGVRKWGLIDSVMTYLPIELLTGLLTGRKKKNPTFHSMRSRNARIGTLFVLPFILGFLVFMLSPLCESLMMSFSSVTIVRGSGYTSVLNGFTNYKYALSVDPDFNTFLVEETGRMAINAIATLVLSFVIAVILNQDFKGRTAARAIFFLPVILCSGVLPGIEAQIGSNQEITMIESVAEELSMSSGINISETLQELLSVSGMASSVFELLFSMIDAIYDIVMSSGIQIIVFLSGLQAISPSLYEAADMEGCTAWESFWKITFPMVSPLLLVNCIYTIIDFFMKNDNKVMEHINKVMYTQMRFGESAAMSWIYFAIALAFILVSSFIITKGVHYYED